MWKTKVLKRKSKKLLRSNYWRIIAVCFPSAMLTTAGAANSEVIEDTIEQISDAPASTFFPSTLLNTATDFLINVYASLQKMNF